MVEELIQESIDWWSGNEKGDKLAFRFVEIHELIAS